MWLWEPCRAGGVAILLPEGRGRELGDDLVGQSERVGEIVEVRGAGGEPPYLVRFDDGHTSLLFPGPDAVIDHSRRKAKKRPAES
jgi:Domain of unknown function (DUF1918)